MDKITRKPSQCIAETRWFYGPDGEITMSFHNGLTEVTTYRTYKTQTAAKTAETKFHNRMEKIYNQKRLGICT